MSRERIPLMREIWHADVDAFRSESGETLIARGPQQAA